jgi:hypothetical protein
VATIHTVFATLHTMLVMVTPPVQAIAKTDFGKTKAPAKKIKNKFFFI